MTINGSTMTATWYIDDLLHSHVDPMENTKLGLYLATNNCNDLTIKRGEVHDYLGIDLDFSTRGVVKVGMIKYIRNIENDFPEPL